tara:strand:+ start:2327 stop:2566 length:240 start_codon:yes stop_codon:yes gene_type:complete
MSYIKNQIEEISTEIDLDRDIPMGEIENDGSPVNVDYKKLVEWDINDRSFDTVSDMLNEMSDDELDSWIDSNIHDMEWK